MVLLLMLYNWFKFGFKSKKNSN